MSESIALLLVSGDSGTTGTSTVLRALATGLLWVSCMVLPAFLLVRCWRPGSSIFLVSLLVALFAACSVTTHTLLEFPSKLAHVLAVAVGFGAFGSLLALGWSLPRMLTTSDHDLEQLRLLRAAVDASGDGIMVIRLTPEHALHSSTPRIVYANSAFARMTGYESDEALGKSPTMLPDPEADSSGLGAIRAALRGQGAVRIEVPNRRKDGTRLWAEWHVVPVPGLGGESGHWVAVLRDTTERRKAQDELRRTRDFLTALLDNIPVPVHVTDADDRLRLVNPAWEQAVGVARDRASGRRVERVMPATAANVFERQNAVVRSTGRPLREEVELNLGRGGRVFLTVTFPVRGPDGKPGAVGTVAIDVTDQVRATNSLREVNVAFRRRVEELEAVIDLSPVGIAVAEDAGCRTVRVNRALRDLLELPPIADPEVTPSPARLQVTLHRNGQKVPPEQTPIQLCIAQGEPVDGGEFEVVLKNDQVMTVVNSARPLFDEAGRVRGCVSVYTDLTARVRMETALRESEELLRGVITHIPSGVFWKDRNSVYLGCNSQVARDWGLSNPQEIVGKTDHELAIDHRTAELYCETDRAVTETGESFLNIEQPLLRPNGEKGVVLTSKVPLRDATGTVMGVLGVYQDITAHKQLEDQLRQAQKMEAVGRLAGGIAHDFNNLLTVINGSAELLRESMHSSSDARELATAISDAGERAAALTRQLLAFGRRSVLEPRVMELSTAIAAAGNMVGRLIGEDIDFRTVSSEPVWVRADAGHLDQVILNLVLNARDAMPEGGTLTIRTRAAEVTAEDSRAHPDARPGPYAVLTVADTGCGMSDEVKTRLFEPFFTTKGIGKGTGLGLATVYGIVTQAGGHIRVTSTLGSGSEFAVYLPRVQPPASMARSQPSEPAGRGGSETLLLAEDEDEIRKFVGGVLRTAGYTVLEASNGVEALRVASQYRERIDLLVTDVVMPQLGGRGLAEALTARHPGLRVLYLSGYTNDAVVRLGIEETQVAFLQKPFTPNTLIRKVRAELDSIPTPTVESATPPPLTLAALSVPHVC